MKLWLLTYEHSIDYEGVETNIIGIFDEIEKALEAAKPIETYLRKEYENYSTNRKWFDWNGNEETGYYLQMVYLVGNYSVSISPIELNKAEIPNYVF